VDLQQLFNIVLGVLLAVLGFLFKELWQSHKDLAKSHNDHVVKVPEHYVTKDDFKEQLNHIRETCDNIWKAIRKGE